MKFTRARDLVATGVIVGVLVNLLLIADYEALPPLPVLAGASLLVLAVVELAFAQSLRARLAGKEGTKPVPPLLAARAVALAKASSLLGAIMAGAWLGVLVYVVPRHGEMLSASGDTKSSVVGLVSAGALIAAALWLEYCCRVRQDDDDRGDHGRLPRSS